MMPGEEASLLIALGSVADWARQQLNLGARRYTSCLISHLLSFATVADDPDQAVENMIFVIRKRAATPEFRRACMRPVPKPKGV